MTCRPILSLSSSLFALLIAIGTVASEIPAPTASFVAVNGEASQRVTPNRAYLTLSADSESASPSSAQKRVQTITEATLTFLLDQGIDPTLLTSSTLSIDPVYEWDQTANTQRLRAYRAAQSIRITVTDLTTLQTLIEGGLAQGITQVSAPILFHSDHAELHHNVLAGAMRNAQSRAQILATTANMQVGAPIAINAIDHTSPQRLREMRVAMAADTQSSAHSQLPGQIEISAAITVHFQLLPLTASASEQAISSAKPAGTGSK